MSGKGGEAAALLPKLAPVDGRDDVPVMESES
jgi:hypothetical protein